MNAIITIGPETRFPLGQIVITANASEIIDAPKIAASIERHAAGDWGDLCDEDRASNDRALIQGGRLFSAYGSDANRFWIITESDRSATTVLMPQDY